ncbi:MAG: oxidoreductase [Cyclobacteriaceae bacterium]
MSKTWFITGASKGLGLSLAQKLLQNGHRVAATSRNKEALTKKVSESNENFLPLTMNLVDEEDVKEAIAQAIKHFGEIDVVVNNAGYGLGGAIEESQQKEVHQNFDVNVYGTLHVIRNILPHMRARKSGHIMNVSSIGGLVASFPGYGIYCATKFAVQGLSEALHAEVQPLGIDVTCVSPGYFRTEFLGDGSMQDSQFKISAYDNVRENLRLHSEDIHGNQAGDPEKAADVFMKLADLEHPPVHLYLGSDAYEIAKQKIDSLQEVMEKHKSLGTSTDF